MADAATIEETIQRYQETFSAGDRDGWLALFAEDSTLEDPVGTPPRHGKEAVGEFFDQMQSMVDRFEMTGCVTQVCGTEAAFHIRIRAITDQATLVMDAIDVMTFDDAGRITSMRAFFDATKARLEDG